MIEADADHVPGEVFIAMKRRAERAEAALASLRPYFGTLEPQRSPTDPKHTTTGYYDAARAAFEVLHAE